MSAGNKENKIQVIVSHLSSQNSCQAKLYFCSQFLQHILSLLGGFQSPYHTDTISRWGYCNVSWKGCFRLHIIFILLLATVLAIGSVKLCKHVLSWLYQSHSSFDVDAFSLFLLSLFYQNIFCFGKFMFLARVWKRFCTAKGMANHKSF